MGSLRRKKAKGVVNTVEGKRFIHQNKLKGEKQAEGACQEGSGKNIEPTRGSMT